VASGLTIPDGYVEKRVVVDNVLTFFKELDEAMAAAGMAPMTGESPERADE